MFKFAHRSRSMRGVDHGGGVPTDADMHGPESPILAEPGLVSDSKLDHAPDLDVSQNGGLPPSDPASSAIPDAHHTYRHRPLPEPPRSRRPSMAQRPSTSGGPGTTSSQSFSRNNWNNFEKRMSKDDLYVKPLNTARNGYKSYHVPIRGKPPSPRDSPRSVSPQRTILVRTQTPDSIEDTMGTIAIGMAIGSPTLPPAEGAWQPQITRVATRVQEESKEASETPAPKHRSGRWKLFGRSKSKKHADSPSPVPSQIAAPEKPIFQPAVNISAPLGPLESNPSLDRSNTDRKNLKYKPIMVRSQTEPYAETAEEFREPKTPRTLSRKASARSIRGDVRLKKSDISAPLPIIAVPPVEPPRFLDVEIPSIKMERYSVMFGSVLQPQGPSALLARRQATLDKLKTINDRIEAEERMLQAKLNRRATSPQPTKSPAFSLFPTTPSRNTNNLPPPRLSPRNRSYTSPALLPSPSKPSFDRTTLRGPVRKDESPPRLTIPSSAPRGHVAGSTVSQRRVEPPQQQQQPVAPSIKKESRPVVQSVPFNFGPDQSGLILDSPIEESPSSIIIQDQLRPNLAEPSWQMITPAASTRSSSPSSTRKRSPSSVYSVQTHVTKPSVDEKDPMLKSAIEISIARQITISQQQRQLLQPLKTVVSPPGGMREPSPVTSVRKSPVKNLVPVGENERLSDTKSATPTLINPVDPLHSQLAQHRKSERIVLEGA